MHGLGFSFWGCAKGIVAARRSCAARGARGGAITLIKPVSKTWETDFRHDS